MHAETIPVTRYTKFHSSFSRKGQDPCPSPLPPFPQVLQAILTWKKCSKFLEEQRQGDFSGSFTGPRHIHSPAHEQASQHTLQCRWPEHPVYRNLYLPESPWSYWSRSRDTQSCFGWQESHYFPSPLLQSSHSRQSNKQREIIMVLHFALVTYCTCKQTHGGGRSTQELSM